jgi:phage terminase small subunit
MYADAFAEYREATENIVRNGSLVADPRTGVPIPNPYGPIRDRALRKLQTMRSVPAAWLWDAAADEVKA